MTDNFTRRETVLARLLCVFGSGLLLLPTLGYGLGFDHGFFHLQARMLAKDLWPYADIWDTAFPGVLAFHIPAVLWDGSAFSLRLIDFGVQIGVALLLFSAGSKLAGPLAGTMGALLYAGTYSAIGYYHTAQRDGFIVPLLLGLLLVLARGPLAQLARRDLVIAGTLLGFAGLIRPSVGLIGVPVVLALAVGTYRLGPRRLADALLSFGIPAILPILCFIGIYAINGRLDSIVDVFLFLVTVYPELERASRTEILIDLVNRAPQMLCIGMLLILVPVLRPTAKRLERWAWVLLLTLVVVRLIESKSYTYQFLPVWSFAALLSGAGWAALVQNLVPHGPNVSKRAYQLAAVMILGVFLPIVSIGGFAGSFRSLPSSLAAAVAGSSNDRALLTDVPRQVSVAQYLRQRVPAQEEIQLWGLYPMVYFLADRAPASRFILPVPFYCLDQARNEVVFVRDCKTSRSTILQERLLTEYMSDLRRNLPSYFVVTDAVGTLEVEDGVLFAPDFPELRMFITENYVLDRHLDGWAVYKAKRVAQPN